MAADAAVEAVLDAAFGADRFGRTAYRVRQGTRALPALSVSAWADGRLIGTLQSWPVALATADGARLPLIMVGPVAVVPEQQGRGFGKALMETVIASLNPQAALPQVMIGDPEYYGRFWGFTNAHTADWDLPGPFEQRRLLVRCDNPAVLPREGVLGPWKA